MFNPSTKRFRRRRFIPDHGVFLGLPDPERFIRRDLSHHRGAERDVLVDLQGRGGDLGRSAEVADPPPGHGEGLREPV